jgi:hypothetical protein
MLETAAGRRGALVDAGLGAWLSSQSRRAWRQPVVQESPVVIDDRMIPALRSCGLPMPPTNMPFQPYVSEEQARTETVRDVSCSLATCRRMSPADTDGHQEPIMKKRALGNSGIEVSAPGPIGGQR